MSDPRLDKGAQDLVEDAWKILRSPGGDPVKLLKLAKNLKSQNRFGLARRLLERAREDREKKIDSARLSLELRQQHALCTYKDRDLPRHLALNRAWRILDHEGDLVDTKNQETLGIAGAIYKRKWEVDAQKSNLERSLAYYYERGHKPAAELRKKAIAGEELRDDSEVALDQVFEGYTSINAAFVLDLLASIEEAEAKITGSKSEIAIERRRAARAIYEELEETLPQLIDRLQYKWWPVSSLGGAQFGLGKFSDAQKTLETAKKDHEPDSWEFESTVRQLANLALIQEDATGSGSNMEDTDAWKTIQTLLGGDKEAARSLFVGKLGLALSGGGFRASLFHIGVLARLAEQDMLRHVHVLSCVSGGSIIGAHYYLEVRKLLQEKWDQVEAGRNSEEVIDRDDYVELVARIARDFLDGVERNLRTRVAGSLVGNLKMALLPNYSRTDRLGELIEAEIYSKIKDDGGGKRYLDELLIEPRDSKEEDRAFHPKNDNWKRRNKVPMLVLNATSLNTGHNWQFTGTWMGESPFSIDTEIDGNWRLRRMWYSESPDRYKPPAGKNRIRLGKAVGASACVPGLFEPVALPELYPKDPIGGKEKEMTVRLVDGGVHDNQGIASLLEQDCDVIIVSDASGQMTSQADPGGGVLGTVLRTNSILMERVRQAQFQDLKARLRSGLLKGLMVLHLKKGLEVDPVDWKECEEPPDVPIRKRSELLRHGVLRRMQELLAGVRTDLDSFSEVEANALMADGYLMASYYEDQLGIIPRAPVDDKDRYRWQFLEIEPPLFTRGSSSKTQNKVERMLRVASEKAFKIWRLSTPLRAFSWLLRASAIGAFIWLWVSNPHLVLVNFLPGRGFPITINDIGWTAVFIVLAAVLQRFIGQSSAKATMAFLRWRDTIMKIVGGIVMATLGFLAATLHILTFDKAFLAMGRLRRALKGLQNSDEQDKAHQ